MCPCPHSERSSTTAMSPDSKIVLVYPCAFCCGQNLVSQESAQLCHILRATRAAQLTHLSLSNDKILWYFLLCRKYYLSAPSITTRALSATQHRTVKSIDDTDCELKRSVRQYSGIFPMGLRKAKKTLT